MADCGDIELEVREDIGRLGELDGMECSLAAMCYELARRMDDAETDDRSLPAISKELRANLLQLFENRQTNSEADLDLGITT